MSVKMLVIFTHPPFKHVALFCRELLFIHIFCNKNIIYIYVSTPQVRRQNTHVDKSVMSSGWSMWCPDNLTRM